MKYEEYFKANCSEDEEDILEICGMACKRLEAYNVKFDDYKILGAFFCKVYDSILTSLEKLEKSYSSFEINFCNRFLIGFTTTEDDDDEKTGNFMIYIRHNKIDKKDYEFKENPPVSNFVTWTMDNLTNQVELISKIASEAITSLKDINLSLGSTDAVIVIFTLTYEAIVEYLTTKRRVVDDFEYEINFLNCFFIGAREGEESDDIYIRPNIESKLRLKNDSIASAKYE